MRRIEAEEFWALIDKIMCERDEGDYGWGLLGLGSDDDAAREESIGHAVEIAKLAGCSNEACQKGYHDAVYGAYKAWAEVNVGPATDIQQFYIKVSNRYQREHRCHLDGDRAFYCYCDGK